MTDDCSRLDGNLIASASELKNKMTQEKVSGTLFEVSNGRTTQSKSQRGEELLTSTKDGAVDSKRHSQHLCQLPPSWTVGRPRRTVETRQAHLTLFHTGHISNFPCSGECVFGETQEHQLVVGQENNAQKPSLKSVCNGTDIQER